MLVVATCVPPVFDAVVLLYHWYVLMVVVVVGVKSVPLGVPEALHKD